MSEDLNEDITELAESYLTCPDFYLQIYISGGCSRIIGGDVVRLLAAYYLQHQEKLEPSISIARLKQLLDETDFDTGHAALENLIDEAEKDGAK